MAYGVTSSGFLLKRLENIKSDIESDMVTEFGADIDLAEDGPLGILISIFAEQFAVDWEGMQAVYNSLSPTTASGVALDRVAAINNISRNEATFSSGELTASGTNGTVIPVGFECGTSTGGRVVSTAAVTIAAGTATVPVRAKVAGDTTYAAGTVTTIVTPVFGVSSVTNAADIDGGQDRETDEEFRVRRSDTLQNAGSSNVEGIRNALLALDFVVNAVVIENTADTVDGDGRQGHSFECYLLTDLGGVITGFPTELQAAAQAIWDAKPAGIATEGDYSDTVVDSQGLSHDIYLSEASEVALTIVTTVTKNTDTAEGDVYPVDGSDQIKAALVAYVGDLNIGQDVWLNKIEEIISGIAGVKGISSTTIDGAATNKTIAATELATLATGDITVNEV